MFISPFVATPIPVVRRMIALSELKKGEVFYDLGCGDGRTVVMAAEEFGAKAVGVELREDLAKKALSAVEERGLQGRALIIHGDLFNIDLHAANVVFLYLTTSANDRVRPKLELELKPGTRVVSHDYEIVGWKNAKMENFVEDPKLGYPSHTIYLYKKP